MFGLNFLCDFGGFEDGVLEILELLGEAPVLLWLDLPDNADLFPEVVDFSFLDPVLIEEEEEVLFWTVALVVDIDDG